ncbi:uncharacterized protein PAF06_017433 [Gastrophryne carolinensis]
MAGADPQIVGGEDKIDQIGEQIVGGEDKIDQIGEQIVGGEDKIDQIGEQIVGGEDKIDQIGGQIVGGEDKIDQIGEQIVGGEDRIDQIGGQIVGGEDRIDQIGGQIVGGEDRIGQIGGQIVGGEDRIDQIGGQIVGGEDRIDQIGEQIVGGEDKIDQIGEQIVGGEDKIDQIGEQIVGGEDRIDQIGGQIVGGEDRISQIGGQIVGGEDRIDQIGGQIVGGEDRIDQIGGQIVGGEDKIDQIGEQIVGGEDKIDQIGEQIVGGEDRIDQIGGQIVNQEELLRILKKVKDRELSVDEAIGLANRNKVNNDLMKKRLQKVVENHKNEGKTPRMWIDLDECGIPPPSQHNFTVYKHRYRWQKRILQIDFYTQMIFNIEKGSLKKKFPFAQVKSCEDKEGLRFLISFHGHQDYELEANSAEDKCNILRIMNEVLQGQRNSQGSILKPFIKKNAYAEVILDGLLELYDQDTDKWVKHLVNVTHDELIFYCSQQLEPKKISLSLAECSVFTETMCASPSFYVQCSSNNYRFRIPINDHNRDLGKSIIMRNDWVALLQDHCQQNEHNHSPKSHPSISVDFNSRQLEPPISPQDVLEKNGADDVPEAYEDVSLFRRPGNLQLLSDTNPSEEDLTKENAFSDKTKILLPPFIPPPPLPTKRQTTPNKTKTFHWNVVSPEKIGKSMWAKNSQKKIDDQRILHQFQASDVLPVTESDISKIQNILLDKKIAHNFNIVLKSFHMEPEQLKEKLLILRECDGGLSDEHLTNLRRYVPTTKDIKMYLSYKGPSSELHVVDQFMLQMCKITDLCSRLDTLLTIRELPSYMKYLHPLIIQNINACNQLLKSRAFLAVLSYILAIGNCLNENAGKGKVRGFQLSSLIKMSQFASKERRFTLMHALVEQILLHEPEQANFPQELTEFEAVAGASVKGLGAEVDVLSKQLEAIGQYRKSFLAKHPRASLREEQFLKDLKETDEHYGAQQEELVKKANEMKKLYSVVLQTFGEGEEQDSQELFGWVVTFIKEFKRAYTDIRVAQR